MAIIYGIGSLRLKSYTPGELTIKVSVPDDAVIELRQNYFHLFWIPFFPLRRNWIVVQSGKKYVLDRDTENKLLLQKTKPGTPFFLYSGSAVVVLALISIVTWNSVLKARGRSAGEDMVKKQISALMQKIATADTFDYFVIKERLEFDKTVLMKVIDTAGENMTFKRLHINIRPDRMDSLKIRQIAGSFQNTGDTVLVNKEILRESYEGNYFLTGEMREGQDMFHDGKKYYLVKVYKLK